MRTQSLAHASSLYSVAQPIRSPPLNRLLLYWPRYLQVRDNGAKKNFTTTRLARDLQHKKKAYSTTADFRIPLAGIDDAQSIGYEDTPPIATTQAHDIAVDHRYIDPKDYLEDYGVEIPEETVEEWQADLRAFPPTFAKDEYIRWLKGVAKCQPVLRQRNSLLSDAQPTQKIHIGKRYQTESMWKASFLRLYAQFDTRLPAEFREPMFLGDPRAATWAQPFLEAPDKETMQSLFLNLDATLASEIWAHIMLYVLYKHPERALEVLNVSMFAARQTSAVELVFSFAVEYALRLGPEAGKPYLHEASQFLRTSLRPDHIADHATFEKNIALFRRHQTTEGALSLYKMLNERGFPLRSWSHLHFAYQSAKHDHILEALEALKAAVDMAERTPHATALSETGAFRSVCNLVLRKLMTTKDGYQAALQVVTSLSQLGFRMTAPLTNVLMLVAVEAGDATTCMGLYNTMPQQGIKRDSWTYDFALRGLRESDNGDQIQTVVNEAFQYQGDGRAFVQNAAMRCLGAFYARESPQTTFEKLLLVYRDHFDLRPLKQLGIVPAGEHSGGLSLLQPDKATVHAMLHYFLIGVENSTQRVWYMWQTLRQLMRNDPFWADCGTSPYFYASFIHALGRSKQQLKFCPLILKDQLRSSVTDGPDDMFNPELVQIRPAAPNTYVMNMLLHAFVRHGHHQAADKMRAFMADRNIPADLVTHNSIIAGYASQQDVERTASALKELDADGLEADEFTHGALQSIADRDALRKALEQRQSTIAGVQGKRWKMASVLQEVNDLWKPQRTYDGSRAHLPQVDTAMAQKMSQLDPFSPSDNHVGSAGTLHKEPDLLGLSQANELKSERMRKQSVVYTDMSTDSWGEPEAVTQAAPADSSSTASEYEGRRSEAARAAQDVNREDKWTSYSPQNL